MKAVLVPGSRFRLYREVDGQPGTFGYVGLATTLAFTTSREIKDATDFEAARGGWTKNIAGPCMSWTLALSGRVDVTAFVALEADQAAPDPHVYRITMGAPGAGRNYTGPLLFETLQRQSQERGFVAFTASCQGAGALVPSSF